MTAFVSANISTYLFKLLDEVIGHELKQALNDVENSVYTKEAPYSMVFIGIK